MWSSLSALWLALLACSAPNSPERAYLAALSDDPAACLSLPPGDLRGECVSMAALALARAGDAEGAQAACDQEQLGIWQGECWFLVSDGLEAVAEQAATLCERAGPHRGQCLGHATSREAKRLLETPGQERAALTLLERRVAQYRAGPRAAQEAWQLVRDARAALTPDQPFTAEMCGDLPSERCAEILRQRLGAQRCAPPADAVAPHAAQLLALAQAGCEATRPE